MEERKETEIEREKGRKKYTKLSKHYQLLILSRNKPKLLIVFLS